MWRGMTDHLQGQFFMINKKNQMLVLEMFFVIHLTLIFSTLLFPLFIYLLQFCFLLHLNHLSRAVFFPLNYWTYTKVNRMV